MTDDPFPDSIRRYLDEGGDVTLLPDWEGLVDEVTYSRAAGLGAHQLVVDRALLDDLTEHGAEALPRDLFDSDEARAMFAVEWRRYYAWVVELLEDEELAARFDAALPPGRLEQERVAGIEWQRRAVAMTVLEALDYDAISTAALERLAEHALQLDEDADRD